MRDHLTHRQFVDRLVVLDDDPTGVQTLGGIRVLLGWDDPDSIGRALAGRRSVHLITNTRAREPAAARAATAAAAQAALLGVAGAHLVLRGDSTLRGHLLEEYLGLCDATGRDRPPLLLVPALPSAGRVTRDGVHMIVRDGRTEPLHETEYARDGVFSYSCARLLEWAEERSDGLFARDEGRAIGRDELRSSGGSAVADALAEIAASGLPGVVVPDAETDGDLELVGSGYAAALGRNVEAVVRCAPALAGILAGTTADRLVAGPRRRSSVLVVCGSYVEMSTRQLNALGAAWKESLVEVDVVRLAGDHAAVEEARAAAAASAALHRSGVAILATPRERPVGTTDLDAGRRIAEGLARTAAAVEPRAGVVIAKGGITAAVTLSAGFGIDEAHVCGPVLPGVSHWQTLPAEKSFDYLVVPGNVGDERLLVDLVRQVMGA